MNRRSDSNERPQGLQDVPWQDPARLNNLESDVERLRREGKDMSDDAFFAKRGIEEERFLGKRVDEIKQSNEKIWNTDRDGDGLTARQEVQNRNEQMVMGGVGAMVGIAAFMAGASHLQEVAPGFNPSHVLGSGPTAAFGETAAPRGSSPQFDSALLKNLGPVSMAPAMGSALREDLPLMQPDSPIAAGPLGAFSAAAGVMGAAAAPIVTFAATSLLSGLVRTNEASTEAAPEEALTPTRTAAPRRAPSLYPTLELRPPSGRPPNS